jgi:hypothetical protein
MALGVETYGLNGNEMTVVIERGTIIPCYKEYNFSTVREN